MGSLCASRLCPILRETLVSRLSGPEMEAAAMS